MLRGVSRNVIEVAQTENQYFERAILFVRPGHRDRDAAFLRGKAEEYMSSLAPGGGSPAVRTRVRRLPPLVLKLGAGLAALAALGGLAAYFL